MHADAHSRALLEKPALASHDIVAQRLYFYIYSRAFKCENAAHVEETYDGDLRNDETYYNMKFTDDERRGDCLADTPITLISSSAAGMNDMRRAMLAACGIQ